MTTETIEGEMIEVGMTVVPPEHQVERLDETATPEGMVSLAARMATALADIVEKKRLYATIQGKKYPQVEAWMTIGRMDNVAAREVRGGITRVEGGGFEAEVELIRLSDGMTVGYGSAMCGTPGDNPWATRPVHVQRSMAVTRATSRAFRQRYSWIMALAGYEPTPADEMPDERGETHQPAARAERPAEPMRPPLEKRAEGLIGEIKAGSPPVDLNLRQTPDGFVYGFKLMAGRKGFQCIAEDDLAQVLSVAVPPLAEGDRVTVYGSVETVPWEKDGKPMPPYSRVHLERVKGPEWILPAEDFDLAALDAELAS